jgi:hypothetical protein
MAGSSSRTQIEQSPQPMNDMSSKEMPDDLQAIKDPFSWYRFEYRRAGRSD